jgi:1,4-dihydroxy-2-naphthoate octaprenyltransferase
MKKTFRNWFIMSRPPFHLVGIFPFILGTVLAYKLDGIFHLAVFLLSLFAVILVMLLTYYNGEYYDIKEDELTSKMDKNIFSGGSQVIAQNYLPRKYAKIGTYVSLTLAVAIGLVLQFYYKTGILTITFGAIGIFIGYFYSNPPFRWVTRGVGEVFIGFCYGWLPVTVAYYIQTQKFSAIGSWMSIPIALAIFNVIFLNEYPDYRADVLANKRNIVVRIGREKSNIIYITVTMLTWIFYGLSILFGVPLMSAYFYIPFFLMSVFIVFLLLRKEYTNNKKLELMCGLNILVNLGITLSYIIGIAIKGVS